MSLSKTLEHPTFGPCELVQHIIAIQWKTRLPVHVIISKLKHLGLALATEAPEHGGAAPEGVRDPRAVHVNQSETLTWATAKKITEEMLDKLQADDEVLWVAPVFRAVRAERGPQSFFAVNPTVVVLTRQGAAQLGELSELGESVSIDEERTRLLRGFVVLNFPQENAIEVGEKLMRKLGAHNVLFENFPFISPATGDAHGEHGKHCGHCGHDKHCGHCGCCERCGKGGHGGHCGHCGHGKDDGGGKHDGGKHDGCCERCGHPKHCGHCGCCERCGHGGHGGHCGHCGHGGHDKCDEPCKHRTCGERCKHRTCYEQCGHDKCHEPCKHRKCGERCKHRTCHEPCGHDKCGERCKHRKCGECCKHRTCHEPCGHDKCGERCKHRTCGERCKHRTCHEPCRHDTCCEKDRCCEGEHVRCTPSTVALTPDDALFPNQWNLQRISAPHAWPITEGDPEIVVAVLDEGVQLDHPDLNMFPLSYSTITHTSPDGPVGPHGTECAGIIGARINNAIGVAGLAGRSRVMAISTNWSDVQVAEGLFWATDHCAQVVSMSFGVFASWHVWNFAIIQAALQFAQAANLVLVAATGNENLPVSRFPASDPTTIGVGGSNLVDARKAMGDPVEGFWGANFGPDLDVVAPCLQIPTTTVGSGYTLAFNGTSSATPQVSALAALILSVNPSLSNVEVRRILSETTDKINQPTYVFAPTAGKPFGTWNNQVGYGRINAERALLVACTTTECCEPTDKCKVDLQPPDECCVSPCEPPWRPCEVCTVCCETLCLCVPIVRDCECPETTIRAGKGSIEFCITFEHKLCLAGKQQGPLLFTQTLLPGEKVTLFHHERYRRITGEADRFSVQTTFLQFLSAVRQAKAAGGLELLCDRLTTSRGNVSAAVGGGLAGLLGGSASTEVRVTNPHQLRVGTVSEAFHRSAMQSAQMTHAERSIVITNQADKESESATARTLCNDNACRAVTYFARQVMELLCVTTRVCEITFRVLAPGISPERRSIQDIGSLPKPIQEEILQVLKHLPKPGETCEHPKLIALATDGVVFDPELACCSSCEPEREAALAIQLEKQKAESLQACLEVQALELELERRRRLLDRGDLSPFGA
jgi:hypothetical protein